MKFVKAVATFCLVGGYLLVVNTIVPTINREMSVRQFDASETQVWSSSIWHLIASWGWLALGLILLTLWWDEIKNIGKWFTTESDIRVK